MKQLLIPFLCLFLTVPGREGVAATDNSVTASATAGKAKAKSRVLWVSNAGNDGTAVRGERSKPWRSVYDIDDSGQGIYRGAVTAAEPGDWIVFEPGTYYVPAIPLNLSGGNSRGVNLLVPSRTALIRTNFSNTDVAALPAGLAWCGPLIIPGNFSKVLIEGTVIATNDFAFDAVFGWADFLNNPSVLRKYGFNNLVPKGVTLNGRGTLIGWSDVIYVSSAMSGAEGSLDCRNVRLRSLWDCCFFSGKNRIQTKKLNAFADVTMGSHASHGVVLLGGGRWIDHGSVFTASGTNFGGDNNASVYILNSTNTFAGTKLVVRGGPNVTPYINVNGHSSGWYWSYQEGSDRPELITLKRSWKGR